MGVTLDESIHDDDEKIEADGLTLLVDKGLLNRIAAATIDFVEGTGIAVAIDGVCAG